MPATRGCESSLQGVQRKKVPSPVSAGIATCLSVVVLKSRSMRRRNEVVVYDPTVVLHALRKVAFFVREIQQVLLPRDLRVRFVRSVYQPVCLFSAFVVVFISG